MARFLVTALFSIRLIFAQNVVTGSYDTSRTGASLAETQLSPAAVASSKFGLLFSLPADGEISTRSRLYSAEMFL